ncbi:Rv2175c family DNA-binding protein [Isoptericola sp. 4D.3]|uniref:Rv2175c family DNA-binding protein n=1 Tax=Isoptericola peretonis TaxID=2918523 RepID=A0ABT0J1G6_9MICO|nr:Rv2175c family DNA-binding protein [Isoptericola sp. 4D.3]
MSETTAPDPGSRTDDRTALESLVDEWLTLPDVAEVLGTEVSKVRGLVSERTLVGIKRGERNTFQVPAAFLVTDDGAPHVLSTLRGTILLLSDAAMDDAAILRWLFETEPSIGGAPIRELRAGRRAQVRRVAQALL